MVIILKRDIKPNEKENLVQFLKDKKLKIKEIIGRCHSR